MLLPRWSSRFSNSTSFADTAKILGAKLDPLEFKLKRRFDIPIGIAAARRRPATRWSSVEAKTLTWYEVAVRNSTPVSFATKPMLEFLVAPEREDQFRTSNLFTRYVVATGIRALASKEAGDLLASARSAARANDMRLAYEKVFRGLNILLRGAQWTRIGSELEEMSSEGYPATFGIGAARFASDVAPRIPNWSAILKKLVESARKQKLDVTKSMRGLLTANETSKGL